jgi:Uma2 family endonuclease
MATATLPTTTLPTEWNLADLHRHLGGIPLERIRLYPPPGMATEADVIAIGDREHRLCELIDGILVEKSMGSYESVLAGILIQHIRMYLDEHNLGFVLIPDGLFRLLPGQIRMPDVSFVRWDRLPSPQDPIPAVLNISPDLAIEVLSTGNTRQEMQRKLEEYFQAGTQLVWYIDPKTRSAKVYAAVDQCEELDETGTLDGAAVLPGFALPLRTLFEKAERRGPA